MKRAIALFTAVSFAAVLLVCAQAYSEDKPAAIIVKVTGTVKVKRGSKEATITGKVSLKLGDKVTVASGGSALVLFANGKKVNVTSSLDITEKNAALDGNKVSAGAALSSAVVGSSGSRKDLTGKGGVGGMVRAAGPTAFVQIDSYLNTNTTNTRPLFAWTPSAKADESTVELQNEDGDVVWTTKTKDTVAAYPEDKDPLEQGKEYTLNVTSVIDGEEVSSSSTFTLLDKKASEEVDKTAASIKKEYAEGDDLLIQHMLLGEFFKEKELYMDAVGELKKLIALNPDDLDSHRALLDIYVKTGNKSDAKSELETVQKLEKAQGAAPVLDEK